MGVGGGGGFTQSSFAPEAYCLHGCGPLVLDLSLHPAPSPGPALQFSGLPVWENRCSCGPTSEHTLLSLSLPGGPVGDRVCTD